MMQALTKVFRGAVIPMMFLAVVFAVAACVPENTPTAASVSPKVPPSFEIDYTQITGANPEERAASLVTLLNTKSEGFAKLHAETKKIKGEAPEKSGALYSYVLMVYGDLRQNDQEIEQYGNKALVLVKQVASYTAKFVADANEPSEVRVQVSFPDGSQFGHHVNANNVKALKGAPIESWLQYVESIELSVIPNEEIAQLHQAYQESQMMTMAFQIAYNEGFLTKDEMGVIFEKLQTAQPQDVPPS